MLLLSFSYVLPFSLLFPFASPCTSGQLFPTLPIPEYSLICIQHATQGGHLQHPLPIQKIQIVRSETDLAVKFKLVVISSLMVWAPKVFLETFYSNPIVTMDAGGAPLVSSIKVSSVVVSWIIFPVVHREGPIVWGMYNQKAGYWKSKGERMPSRWENLRGNRCVQGWYQIAARLRLDTFDGPGIRALPIGTQ